MCEKRFDAEEVKINNYNCYNERFIPRTDFTCIRVVVYPQSEFAKSVKQSADKFLPKLNKGGANSSENRNNATVEVDNLSGVLAEIVCEKIMHYRYGDIIKRTEANTSKNQIDIDVANGKTIEVRSSCIRNGIEFALFAKDKNKPDYQYVDILGPYSNGYKPDEKQKDYYMRVIFPFDINMFMPKWNSNQPIELYVTGGANRKMMFDCNLSQTKHLKPENANGGEETDYRTIPIGKSLDIKQFFEMFESENGQPEVKNDISEQISKKIIGNKRTGFFHTENCPVFKTALNERVIFNSADEAIENGYRPCYKCIK